MQNEKRTIGETARFFNVTTVTIRNWVSLLGETYLSPSATRKTGKRFSNSDVTTLKKLRTLLEEGSTYDQVLDLLPTTPEIVEETTEEPALQSAEQPGSAIQTLDILEKFQALMKLQQQQNQETINAMGSHIETLKEENLRLQTEIERLKTPWFKKLFTR